MPLLRDSFDVSDIPVHAVMLPERHRLPKIRACVDYWTGGIWAKPGFGQRGLDLGTYHLELPLNLIRGWVPALVTFQHKEEWIDANGLIRE